MRQELIVPVSSVVLKIKTILNQTMDLSYVWIQGEISNLTKHRSGHYYFSLKDENSEISCVMFSSNVHRLDFNVQEGMKVLIQGNINVYEPRGSLQLYVKSMKQDGMGNLYLEFENRKKRLLEQGYFEQAHKKSKPDWIDNIGIITAKEGAALQDVLKTIRSRFPMMKMTLYPAYVQGNFAPKSIIEALLKADTKNHDALLLVRGGGSFEDLFCFNDENLVKTIYSLNTYIVSGVGHETDTTLTDLVSDHRAVTPTAAAQWVSVDVNELRYKFDVSKDALVSRMNQIVSNYKNQLAVYKNHPYLVDPHTFIIDKTIQLDSYDVQLKNAMDRIVKQGDRITYLQDQMRSLYKHKVLEYSNQFQSIDLESSVLNYLKINQDRFYKNVSLLDAYSPLKILSRGYSIVKKDKDIIRSIEQVDIDDEVSIRIHDGTFTSKVIKKES